MKVSVKIDREKQNYGDIESEMKKKMQQVITYGTNATRNTAIENISRGAKSGETYEKYNPRRTHIASSDGQPPASDTGFLVSNIKRFIDGDGLGGEVRSRAFYSKFLEFGTSKMLPRPFMFPALEKNRQKIITRIKKAVKTANARSSK